MRIGDQEGLMFRKMTITAVVAIVAASLSGFGRTERRP